MCDISYCYDPNKMWISNHYKCIAILYKTNVKGNNLLILTTFFKMK